MTNGLGRKVGTGGGVGKEMIVSGGWRLGEEAGEFLLEGGAGAAALGGGEAVEDEGVDAEVYRRRGGGMTNDQ